MRIKSHYEIEYFSLSLSLSINFFNYYINEKMEHTDSYKYYKPTAQ